MGCMLRPEVWDIAFRSVPSPWMEEIELYVADLEGRIKCMQDYIVTVLLPAKSVEIRIEAKY